MIEYNRLDNWETNSFITTNQAIGSVVSTERHTNDDWECMLFPVSKGDKIFIIAQGGDNPRAVSILDDEYKMLYNSNAQAKTNKMMNVEQDGFVIVNNRKATFTTPEVLHYPFSQDNTDLGRVYTTHNHGEDTTEEYQARNIGKGYIQDNNYQPGDFNVNEQMCLLGKYGVTKIDNQLWITENLDEELGTLGVDEWYYNGRSNETRLNIETSGNMAAGGTGDLRFYISENDVVKDECAKFIADKNVYVSGKYSINMAQTSDIISQVYLTYRTEDTSAASYLNLGTFTLPANSTEINFTITKKIPANIVRATQFFIRFGSTVTAKPYWSYISNFVVGLTNNVTTSSITFEQALANEETYKSKKYGRLYTWNNVNDNISKLGLTGWHIPNRNDFGTLVNMDSTGSIFRGNDYNGGTNTTGLTLKHVGYRSLAGQNFIGDDSNGSTYLWSSETTGNSVYALNIYSQSIGNSRNFNKNEGFAVRLVLDLNEDGSYPEDATPLKLRETYRPYNRNIGLGAKPYTPNDDGKVYVDDVRCDIVCPHDKPQSETQSETLSLASETVSEPIIEE